MSEQENHQPEAPLTRRELRAAERARESRRHKQKQDGPREPSGVGSPASPAPQDNFAGEPLFPSVHAAPTQSIPSPAGAPAASGRSSREREPKKSRAGRNLGWAIVVGVVLGAMLLASLFIQPEGFVVLAFAASALALWEFARAVRNREIMIPVLPLVVGAAGILISAYTSGIEAMWVAFVLTAGGVFIWRVLDGTGPAALRDAVAAIFAAAYIPFMAGFVVLMLHQPGGPWAVLAFIVLVVSNDLGGYVTGVLFGKRAMAPSVSPNKTWEGLAGSVTLTVVVGTALMLLVLEGPWWAGVVLGVVTTIAATVGDLSESLLKRDLGVKDMGRILPGHGGVLDRIDSMLIAAPVVFGVQVLVLGG